MRFDCLDDLGDAELYVRYAVCTSLHKRRHDHLSDHFTRQDFCDILERFERTHSVVVALSLNVVGFDDLGDEGGRDPFNSEGSSHRFNLLNAHFTDRGSRVGQVLEEDALEATCEDLNAERD